MSTERGCRWRRRRPSASNRARLLYPTVVGYSSETTARICSDLQLVKSLSAVARVRLAMLLAAPDSIRYSEVEGRRAATGQREKTR